MTYWPSSWVPVPPLISFRTKGWGWTSDFYSGTPTSGTYTLANRAYYVPILVPAVCVARRVWWYNGATVSASYDLDCGIYTDAGYKPGTRLVSSGSTAQGTASVIQFVDITDTALSPGLYWIAIACSSASATLLRNIDVASIGPSGDAIPRFQQSTALPLPDSATPVEVTSTTGQFLFGFATTASP